MNVPDFTTWLAVNGPAIASVAAGFVAGCLAGSFLNVIAHRVPRRETVVFGRSRCPACGATIRSRDNVPVLGWIALRGRCRDCATSISARYPLVEAGCGTLVAVVAAAELAGGHLSAGATVAWAGHAVVALTLAAWALLAERGHAVSRVTVGTATVVTLAAAVLVPALAPLCVGCSGCAGTTGWRESLVAALAGLGVGWVVGSAGGGRAGAACGLVGVALGWQTALLAGFAAGGARACWRHAAAAPLAAMTALVCWHPVRWAWEGLCRAAGAE